MKNLAMPSSSEHIKEKSRLEEAITQLANNTNRFMTETNTNLQNQAASIQNLKVQVGQLVKCSRVDNKEIYQVQLKLILRSNARP